MVTASDTTNEQLEIMIPEAASRLAVVYVPRVRIHPDPDQPRVEADADLRSSIAREGLLQPVIVRVHPMIIGDFMLIDGERRWLGSEGVLEDLPVILRDDKDNDFTRLATQLIANSGKPLAPMEEARAFATLMATQGGLSLADLAKLTGKPRSTIGDRLALLQMGPWVPLIDAGTVPISFVTRFLSPFKGVRDGDHEQAIRTIEAKLRDVIVNVDANAFADAVQSAYRPLLHPLTKIKGSYINPLFDTTAHDQQCDCGRIEYANGENKARDWCGNPGWWKPLAKAAEKAARVKDLKDAPLRNALSRPSGPRYQLPIDAAKPIDTGYNGAPKGVVELSDAGGHWKVQAHQVMTDDFFDPTTVEIRDKNLVLLKSKHAGTCIATRDNVAIAAARKAWCASRAALLDGAREQLALVYKKKGASAAVQGKGAGVLLAMVVSARSFAGEVAGNSPLDAATVAKVPLPPKGAYEGYNTEGAARKWADTLSDKQAAAVLSVIAFVNSDAKVQWPQVEVEHLLKKKAEAIAKKNVPWLATGKAAKAGASTDADELNDEGDDE